MALRFDVIEIVVADMARSLAFYRRLGIDAPSEADEAPHVDIALPGGMGVAFDTIDTIKSCDPSSTAPTGGHRIALAFACDSPAEVDSTFRGLVDAGYKGHLEPWDAFWGQRYAIVEDPD